MNAPEPIDALVQWARRIAVGISRARHLYHCADLAESAALEALSRALNRYDPERGEFRTYAVKGIVGAVLDELGPEAGRLSVEAAFDAADGNVAPSEAAETWGAPADALAAAVMDALVAAFVGEELRLNGEARLINQELMGALHDYVDRLPGEDRRLVMLRYWEERTWEDVAIAMKMSDRRAREHDLRIRKRLKAALLSGERAESRG